MTTARANARAAVVDLMRDYRDDAEVKVSVYQGRPKTIALPHGFIDRITEAAVYPANVVPQRTLRVEVVILWGLFDSGDAVAQADTFTDGFMDWVVANVHASGGNTTIGVVAIEDEPEYVPEWLAPDAQRVHFASRITLEVYDPG